MPSKRSPDEAAASLFDAEPASLAALNDMIAAMDPLSAGAPRAVPGEGPVGAPIAFVGEQPGDQEETQGRPFVGPAGRLFSRALEDAGLDRKACYLTNAVKHFKFQQRGRRRIHEKPSAGEVKRYRWALEKELGFVHPHIVVALGATAALALAGRSLSVLRERGPFGFDGRRGYVTVHPSFLLRLPDEASKRREYDAFVEDLRRVGALAQEL